MKKQRLGRHHHRRGIVGAATGYYLAKAGLRVALFERGYLCSGSTVAASAG